MESDLQKKRKSAEDSALFDNVASEKLKFPLYIFSDTMEKVNMLYETDNCRSKTEFMEKAIRRRGCWKAGNPPAARAQPPASESAAG